MAVGGVIVVNRHNLKAEFQRIKNSLRPGSYVAVDTEFPGTVHKPKKLPSSRGLYFGSRLHVNYDCMGENVYDTKLIPSSPVPTPQDSYDCMRKNVNDTKLIQLGLTVCDNMMEPLGVWEFNFNEFDDKKDRSDPASITMLKSHGIDFARNRKEGVSEGEFAQAFVSSGLAEPLLDLKWVFFHCTYDVGYLIKNLTQEPLPAGSVNEFMGLMHKYLGRNVFDLKEMKPPVHPTTSGLDKLSQTLGIPRTVGRSHQAGSDSLLTFHCFREVVLSRLALAGPVYPRDVEELLQPWTYVLHGLPHLPPQYVYAYGDQVYYNQVQEHPQFFTSVQCLPSLVIQ